jgi:hypothetical protein
MVDFAGHLDREALRALLEARGVDQDSYCLDGGHPVERYVLDDRRSEWVVYYSERGISPACGVLQPKTLRVATSVVPQRNI